MGYAQALEKAWSGLSPSDKTAPLVMKMLNDSYNIDIGKRTVFAAARDVRAKDYIAIILLHYLARRLAMNAPAPQRGEWIDFNQLEGGAEYYPAFKRRTIDRITKRYGNDTQGLVEAAAHLPSERYDAGDVGMIVYPFDDVPMLITLWKADDEFGPEANILFDKSIARLFCTEDVVVLTEIVVHSL